jgi:type IV pilus assembly protein PilC
MKFKYIASQPDGRVQESQMEAKNVAEVLAYLANNGLRPVSVRPVERGITKTLSLFKGRVDLTDQIFISKYLSLMLKIGTGLMEAINILVADFNKPAVKEILLEIRSSLERGNPFYSTFARYPNVFSSVYINLVRAGEASGNLEKIFDDLTTMLTKNKDLRDQIRSALVYPVLLLIGSILILFFMTVFALPKISAVFSDSGFEPPAFSRFVFGFGNFMQGAGIYIFGVLIVVAVVSVQLFRSSPTFRRFLTGIINEIPVVKDVIKKMALQRFANVLASLIRAGMPLTEALEITAQASGNIELKDALLRISREGLSKGLTVGEAFKREPFFPQIVVNLMAISERAGHIEEVLNTLSDFYVKEIDNSIKTLVSFLEPALLLFIGVVIGGIALAVIIPIYQLTTQF